MNKKLLLSMTAGLLLLSTAVIIPLSNNNAQQLSFAATRKSVAAPAEVNYQGFHKITKTTTLVGGCDVTFVRKTKGGNLYASNNTIAGGYLKYEDLTSQISSPDLLCHYSFKCGVHVENEINYFSFKNGNSYLGFDGGHSFDYTSTISDYRKYSITIENGAFSIKVKASNYYVTFNSTSGGFYFDDDNDKYVDLYVNVDSVVEAWAQKYLKPELDAEGQCVDLFPAAKSALLAMDDYVISDLYYNTSNASISAYKLKYENWAKALGQQPYQA